MRERFTRLSGLILGPSMICLGITAAPPEVIAAWPGHAQNSVQPVLITTLALTSLVLFVVYVLTRKQIRVSSTRDKGKAKPPALTTDLALDHLFTHPKIPMAKLSLDNVRILDATPPLFMALGYPKIEFLKKTGDEIAMIRKEEIPQLLDRGWNETQTRLFNKTTGDWEKYRIINIIFPSAAPPCILSIVTGICDPPASESLSGFLSHLLDNRTIIQ